MKSKKFKFEERKMLDSGHLKAIMPLFVRKYTFSCRHPRCHFHVICNFGTKSNYILFDPNAEQKHSSLFQRWCAETRIFLRFWRKGVHCSWRCRVSSRIITALRGAVIMEVAEDKLGDNEEWRVKSEEWRIHQLSIINYPLYIIHYTLSIIHYTFLLLASA